MPIEAIRFVRVLIVVQLLVSVWFVLSPDNLPEAIKHAEMLTDQESYAALDGVIIPLSYLQAALCLAIWRPTRIASFAYLSVTVLIACLGVFSGPAILSAIDALLGYLQVLASGALIGVLWVFGYLLPAKDANSLKV